MKEPRRLALKRETLTALTTDELGNVAGARAITYNCTTVTQDSYRICSLQCQWTFNTCEC